MHEYPRGLRKEASRKELLMFTRVLLPLDGSTRAERAIPTAVQLVRACGGTLILAHIRSMNVPYALASAPEMTQELIEQDLRAGEAYLTRTAHLPEMGEIAIEQVVMYGPVASTLLSLIAS